MDCTFRYQSNAAFCAKHKMSASREMKGSCKMPCSPCLTHKAPIIPATTHPECSSTFPNCNVSAAVILLPSDDTSTGQQLWHTDTHSHDLSIGKTHSHSMKAAIQHQPQIATFFLWELCTLEPHCFNKSLIVGVYIVVTASTSGRSL